MNIHKNIKNKIGKRYGRLIVIEITNKRTHSREVIWKCQCDCGNQKEVSSGNLISGAIRSCGCLQKESIAKIGVDRTGANIKDIIGDKYGRLIVIKNTGKRKNRAVIWECKCDCGKIVEIRSCSLINGSTKSCGCLQKERASKILHKDIKGKNHWNWGKHWGKETKNKISNSLKGKLTGEKNPFYGKTHTERVRQIVSESNKKRVGELSGNWKGGITPLNFQIRDNFKSRQWHSDIFTRDNFTCQECGDDTGGNLNAHHIKSLSFLLQKYEIINLKQAIVCEELWNINNGVTLCIECHKKEHEKILGKKVKDYASSTL